MLWKRNLLRDHKFAETTVRRNLKINNNTWPPSSCSKNLNKPFSKFYGFLFIAPFNNMRTLKFKIQRNRFALHCRQSLEQTAYGTITFGSTVSKGHVRALWLVDFDPLCRFLYFCGQPVVAVIVIDDNKKRKSLLEFEVPNPYVIERRSNHAAISPLTLRFR